MLRKPSILRKLGLAFITFGLAMGLVFPFYAHFFVEWKPGMQSWFNIGCIVAGITIGGANYWLVNLILLRQLRRISTVATAIAGKDLTLQCTLESHDLVGEIVGSFNHMAKALRNMVRQVNEATSRLSEQAGYLSSVTEQNTCRADQQQREICHVASAVDEMVATVREVSDHASRAAQAARQADESASAGQQVVDQTVARVSTLATEVEQTASLVSEMGKDSDSIGTVLGVIKGIAEQTNLLALNAAIEAARAGEQGRGFAVVADEVRTLAARTQQSAQEIQDMIERLQASSQEAVKAMGKSQRQAHANVEHANEVGIALETMVTSVASISEMSHRIAEAMEHQRATAEGINHNVTNITRTAEQSADHIHNAARAGDDLCRFSRHLQAYVAEFQT